MNTLNTWHTETVAELEAARQVLAAAIEAEAAAAESQRAAVAHREAMRATLAPLRAPMSRALTLRVRAEDDDLRAVENIVTRAKADLMIALHDVTDLEASLEEIASLIGPKVDDPDLIEAKREEAADAN
jgi:hypothetical protein